VRGKTVEDFCSDTISTRIHAPARRVIGREGQDCGENTLAVFHQLGSPSRGSFPHQFCTWQAKDQGFSPRRDKRCQILDNVSCNRPSSVFLHTPVGKRMGRGRTSRRPFFLAPWGRSGSRGSFSCTLPFLGRLLNVIADRGADFDHVLGASQPYRSCNNSFAFSIIFPRR